MQQIPDKIPGIDLPNTSNYEVWGFLTKLQKLISRARSIELNRYGITPEQSHVLHILENNGGTSTMNEIAGISLVHHNAVSTLIVRMEKLGLVTKVKKAESRQYVINITEKGRDIFTQMPVATIEMIFSAISEDERRIFLDCMKKLEMRASTLLGTNYKPPIMDL